MTKAKNIMDDFMKKFCSDEFERENLPNKGPQMDDAFVEKQLASYSKLLKSGIIEAALDKQG